MPKYKAIVEKYFGKRPNWQKEIINIAPDFFISNAGIDGKDHGPGPHLLMAFGISCGQGWAPILKAFIKLCKHEVKNDRTLRGKVKMAQIKEKFGGLRIYCSGNAAIQGAASFAETLSYEICERCGAAGRPNSFGWIATLCKNCRAAK